MGRHLEDWVAWSIAAVLAAVGSTLIASYPAARYFTSRERADIERAASAIFSTSLANLQTTTGRTFEVRVPDDGQWRRIEARLQAPTLVVMAVSGEHATSYPRSVAGLRVRAWRNRTELELTPIRAILHSGEGDGFELTAKRGDRLAINLRSDSNSTPADAVVIVAPNWSAPTLGSWGEGAAAGEIILPIGGIVLAIVGVCLLLWALTFLWGRPTFTMSL